MADKQIDERFKALYPRLYELYGKGVGLLADELMRLAEALDGGHYGLADDPDAAARLLAEAAGKGHALAMVEMMARAMERDGDLSSEAVRWMQAAAATGEVETVFSLGIARITGQGGVEIDVADGWRLIEIAADRSHPEACFQLAADWLKGGNRPANPVRAKYFELAALEAGSQRASDFMSHFFDADDLKPGTDHIDNRRIVERAAADGLPRACLELANTIFIEENENAADNAVRGHSPRVVELLEKSAEGGCTDAMCNLAEMLTAKGDTEGARRWLERAAAAGHHAAKGMLGAELARSADPAEAERGRGMLIESVNFGFNGAQHSLAELTREGVMEDPTDGVRAEFYDTLFLESFEAID